MPVKAIVGANWGDEGKGKITDVLAQQADIVVRFQGGANAGHTIINEYGRFALHLLPSGVFSANITNVIGNGVAFDVPKFAKELKALVEGGVPEPKILVSDRVQLLMPYHVLQDTYEEERLAGKAYGSTHSGIAPFYSDKYAKIGIQACELFDDQLLKEKTEKICAVKNVLFRHLYGQPELVQEELLETLREYRDILAPYLADTSLFIRKALKDGKKVLAEGQLGTLKDPDFGIYPMVTSSNTIAAYAPVGAGFPPYELKEVVAVTKAYARSVGGGDFVSEILDPGKAEELRKHGGDRGEYGATTGRPRRVGWFDAVASRYGCAMQGATEVALTVVDALGYLEEIPVCTGYELDGKIIKDFPVTPVLAKCKPVLTVLPGWHCDIRGIRNFEDLPENCRKYVEFIEKEIGFPITMVSNGPGRDEIIYRK